MCKALSFIALLLPSLCAPVSAGERLDTQDAVIHIGVLAYRGKQQALQRWSPTAAYLSERIGREFEIVPVDLDEIATAINAGNIHFTLTNPGNYVSLEARFGASRIATISTLRPACAGRL